MKKLMTTVSAVAVAFGLYATDTGTSFEGLDAADMDPYNITATTGELASGSYWVTNGTETLKVVAGVSKEGTMGSALGQRNWRPKQYLDNAAPQAKYLSIKTTLGNPVQRNAKADGTGTAIGDEGFYFDSLVKFTAFEGDQTVNLGTDGKLAIWLRENVDDQGEPTGSTNLMVTAGYLVGNTAVVTNYECEVHANFDYSDWHRVTVKAIDNIIENGANPGFVVYVDGVCVTSSADKGLDGVNLTDNAWVFHVDKDGALFPSAVQLGENKSKIFAVQFDGQGEVDDLVFTDIAPDFAGNAAAFTIKVGDANVTNVSYRAYNSSDEEVKRDSVSAEQGQRIADIRIPYSAGMYVLIEAKYAAGHMEGQWEGVKKNSSDEFRPSAGGLYVQINSAVAGATVTINDVAKPYPTLAAALAAIEANDVAKITLNAETDAAAVLDAAGANVTLDLAGNDIAVASGSAITLTAGSLTITNSAAANGAVSTEDSNGYSVKVGSGTSLTVAGGRFNTGMDVNGSLAIVLGEPNAEFVVGGTFDDAIVEWNEADPAVVPANYQLALNQAQTYYVLTYVAPPATVTVTVNGGANATATWTTNGVAAAEAPATLTEGDTYEVYYTANAGYKFADGAKTNASGTVGTENISITIADAVALELYTAISLNKATTSIETNLTETLVATTTPASAADDSVTWSSSDDTVATVDQNGVVTAIAAGTATITAATANYSATCVVTVTATEPQPATPTIEPGNNVITVNVKAESADAAKAAVTVTPPATGIDVTAYTELFNIEAKAGATEGTFDVSITGIKDSVVTGVNTEAVAVFSGDTAVAVPAGLYYRITPATALPVSGEAQTGLSTTGSVTVSKPGTTQGFLKVELSATPFPQN